MHFLYVTIYFKANILFVKAILIEGLCPLSDAEGEACHINKCWRVPYQILLGFAVIVYLIQPSLYSQKKQISVQANEV